MLEAMKTEKTKEQRIATSERRIDEKYQNLHGHDPWYIRDRSSDNLNPSSEMAFPGETSDPRSYQDFIKAQVQRYPCLQNLVDFFNNGNVSQQTCTVTCLEVSESRCRGPKNLDLESLQTLLNNEHKKSSDLKGRLLIVQDPSTNVIETPGSRLDIDPLFFATYIDIY